MPSGSYSLSASASAGSAGDFLLPLWPEVLEETDVRRKVPYCLDLLVYVHVQTVAYFAFTDVLVLEAVLLDVVLVLGDVLDLDLEDILAVCRCAGPREISSSL